MRIKLGSVAYLRAANSGYGIGLDDAGHRVEFLGDRHVLALAMVGEYLDVEDWEVLAVDDELRLPLTRLAMAQRTAFIRAALAETAGVGVSLGDGLGDGAEFRPDQPREWPHLAG